MTPEQLEALLDGPALAPPHNVKPDPNQRDFGNAAYGVSITICVIITIVVAMRIFIRAKLLRRLSLEDYLLLFAWLAYTAGYNTIAVMLAGHHLGKHQWNMTLRELVHYLFLFHAGTILYGIVILPLKLSIIIQVLRAFVPSGARNFTFWMSHALIWVNILFYIISTALTIFACQPTAKSYNPTIQGGHCLDSVAVNIAAASLNSLSDALLLILPQQVIWKLSLPKKRKVALSFAFLGGILSFTSAVVRLYYLITLDHSKDITYYSGLVGLWSFPEIASGFLVACLPVVRGFLHYIREKVDTPRVKTLKTRLQTIFGGPDGEGSLSNGKEQQFNHQNQHRYHYARPQQISDIEYHELVVKSQNSWMMEMEAADADSRRTLVAKPPTTLKRSAVI